MRNSGTLYNPLTGRWIQAGGRTAQRLAQSGGGCRLGEPGPKGRRFCQKYEGEDTADCVTNPRTGRCMRSKMVGKMWAVRKPLSPKQKAHLEKLHEARKGVGKGKVQRGGAGTVYVVADTKSDSPPSFWDWDLYVFGSREEAEAYVVNSEVGIETLVNNLEDVKTPAAKDLIGEIKSKSTVSRGDVERFYRVADFWPSELAYTMVVKEAEMM